MRIKKTLVFDFCRKRENNNILKSKKYQAKIFFRNMKTQITFNIRCHTHSTGPVKAPLTSIILSMMRDKNVNKNMQKFLGHVLRRSTIKVCKLLTYT